MKKIFSFLLIITLFALSGCAKKEPPVMPAGSASERWQSFVEKYSGAGSYDTLSGSLRFGPVDETKRVTYTLLSKQDEGAMERRIRIDISAGLGGNVGTLYFSDGKLTLLLPSEGRIYIGSASDENLKRLLGLSLPLSVQKLNDFLAGRLFSALDEPQPERYETQEDGKIVYFYGTERGLAELTLDAQALPVRWKEQNGWTMEMGFSESGLPSKMSGRIEGESGEHRLVLLVKERRPASGLQASNFRLHIPAGFTVYSLD